MTETSRTIQIRHQQFEVSNLPPGVEEITQNTLSATMQAFQAMYGKFIKSDRLRGVRERIIFLNPQDFNRVYFKYEFEDPPPSAVGFTVGGDSGEPPLSYIVYPPNVWEFLSDEERQAMITSHGKNAEALIRQTYFVRGVCDELAHQLEFDDLHSGERDAFDEFIAERINLAVSVALGFPDFILPRQHELLETYDVLYQLYGENVLKLFFGALNPEERSYIDEIPRKFREIQDSRAKS